MKSNPFSIVRQDRTDRKPAVRYVTAAEYAALEAACPDVWWKAFLSLMYYAGLRLSETVHLTWSDIDFTNLAVRVAAKSESDGLLEWSPKSYESRTVPLPTYPLVRGA